MTDGGGGRGGRRRCRERREVVSVEDGRRRSMPPVSGDEGGGSAVRGRERLGWERTDVAALGRRTGGGGCLIWAGPLLVDVAGLTWTKQVTWPTT